MEQYIRITKCDRSSYWYSELIGKTYPVVRVTSRGDYEVARNEAEGFAFSIFKSDCELVSITVNTMPEGKEPSVEAIESSLEEAAKAHGNYTSFEHGERFQTAYNSFKSGAIWQKWQKEQSIGTEQDLLAAGDLKKRWLQEKEGYTITEEQEAEIKLVHDFLAVNGHSNRAGCLRVVFPEVFKPKRTYAVGDEYKAENTVVFKIVNIGLHTNKIAVLADNEFILPDSIMEVKDPQNITREEIGAFIPEDCTLIEPSNP